ncbi:hypothetical protein Cgig2_030689 [Carnegiea gigantea]|uniref:Pentatricopeptide repeat-containing protein n=1 Tax=Carnegiea gigantea TaxID=171969 RepID=A0A9Q1GPH0_9CARY|nr:hypothetical protein Cgig2_030689 [Carnegiea gigantea]
MATDLGAPKSDNFALYLLSNSSTISSSRMKIPSNPIKHKRDSISLSTYHCFPNEVRSPAKAEPVTSSKKCIPTKLKRYNWWRTRISCPRWGLFFAARPKEAREEPEPTASAITLGRWDDALSEMLQSNIAPTVITFSTLIDMYSKARMIEEANSVLKLMHENIIADGLCEAGKLKDAANIFSKLLSKGLQPD